jgi:hypothetical protein
VKLVAFAILIAAIAICGTIAVLLRWDCDAVALTSGGGRGNWLGDLGSGVREPGGRELAGRWNGSMNLDVGSREIVVCVDRWTNRVAYWLRDRGWTTPADRVVPTPAPTAGQSSDNVRPLATPSLSSGIVTMDGKKYRLYSDGHRELVE